MSQNVIQEEDTEDPPKTKPFYGMDGNVHPDRRKWISLPLVLRQTIGELRESVGRAGLAVDLGVVEPVALEGPGPSTSSNSRSRRSIMGPSPSASKPLQTSNSKSIEEMANKVTGLVKGGDFFNVRLKPKPKKRGRKRKLREGEVPPVENEEDERTHALLEAMGQLDRIEEDKSDEEERAIAVHIASLNVNKDKDDNSMALVPAIPLPYNEYDLFKNEGEGPLILDSESSDDDSFDEEMENDFLNTMDRQRKLVELEDSSDEDEDENKSNKKSDHDLDSDDDADVTGLLTMDLPPDADIADADIADTDADLKPYVADPDLKLNSAPEPEPTPMETEDKNNSTSTNSASAPAPDIKPSTSTSKSSTSKIKTTDKKADTAAANQSQNEKKEDLVVATVDAENKNNPNYPSGNGQSQGQGESAAAGEGETTEQPEPARSFDTFMDRALKIKMKKEKEFSGKHKERLMEKMNLTDEQFNQLHNIINPATFSVLGETYQDESSTKDGMMPVLAPPIPEVDSLRWKSLSVFISHSEDPTGFQWRSNNVQQQINDDIIFDNYQKRMKLQTVDYLAKNSDAICKEEEFLIELSYFHGGHPDETLSPEVKMHTEPKLAYKLELLGSNTVADLISALRCENDFLPLQDVQHPKEKFDLEKITTNEFRATMVMIDKFVFCDFSGKGGIDYCTKINEWTSATPEKGLGNFTPEDLQTQLQDIRLRFGYPYLFVHQGMCEHIIVFNKARLMEKVDEHCRSKYPRVSSPPNFKNVYCRVDNEHLAQWAVVDYKEFPESPMMICTECVLKYCYMKNGRTKRGDFKLFPLRQLASEM